MEQVKEYVKELTEQSKREEQASLSLLSTESERLQELLQFQLQIASIEELINDIKRHLDDITRNVHALKESTHTILLYELNMLHVFSNWMNADDVQYLKKQLQSSLQQTINLNVNQHQGDDMSFTTGAVNTGGGKFQQAMGDITEGDKVTNKGNQAVSQWYQEALEQTRDIDVNEKVGVRQALNVIHEQEQEDKPSDEAVFSSLKFLQETRWEIFEMVAGGVLGGPIAALPKAGSLIGRWVEGKRTGEMPGAA